MVRFKTIRNALEKIESVTIQKVPDTDKAIAKRACFDKNTKQYKFFDNKGNEIVKFHQYDVRSISRLLTDDNKFEMLVSLKNDIDYRMEFFMRDGYSFFAANDCERENIEAIIKAVPKYLCDFKGKSVVVRKSINHEAFSTWNPDNDNEDLLIVEKFVISDFDYGVRKKSGLAVVDFLDKSTVTNNKATAIDVTFVVSDTDNEGTIIVGTTLGEFLLTPLIESENC